MHKYFAAVWQAKIEKVEIERETAKSVWLKCTAYYAYTRRENKFSKNGRYFDTFEEAKTWAKGQAEHALKRAENRVRYAEEHLKKVQKLKEE